MQKFILLSTFFLSFQAFSDEPQEIDVEHYYQAFDFNRATECVYGKEIFSVGMEIERGGKRFVCNNFEMGSQYRLDAESPASWRVKNMNN